MAKLVERCKGQVKFIFFKDDCLWYETEDGWQFPVPIEDTKNGQGASATFNAIDKGIFFMRWIKKYMEFLELERELAIDKI